MTVKERVYRLVDVLPEDKLPEAERLLESLLAADPLLDLLANAPEDDEIYTEEEQKRDEDALAAYQRGEYVPLAEFKL